MENNQSNLIQKIVQISPLISGALIVSGLGKLTLKFWFYKINILEYISIGEALLVSINEIYKVGLFFAGFYLGSMISNWFFNKVYAGKINKIKTNLSEEDTKDINFKLFIVFILPLLILTIGFIIHDSYNYFETGRIFFQNRVILNLIITGPITYALFRFLQTIIIDESSRTMKSSLFFYFAVVFSFMFTNIYNTENEKKYENFKHPKNVIKLKNDENIQLDSTLYQIGRTNNFTFLYNKENGIATIISNEEIKSYIINNNE